MAEGTKVLPFSVTVIEEGRHRSVGEYRSFRVARTVARLKSAQKTVSVAVVKDRDGRMVYASDDRREWEDGK